MLQESAPKSIREIKQAAGKEIQNYVLARIGEIVTFPAMQLRGEKGHLISYAGVIVDHGVPKEGQIPEHVVRDAVVLLPDGLFVGAPVKTPAENGAYSITVPALEELKPASPEIYLEYGERALITLDKTIQAQISHKGL